MEEVQMRLGLVSDQRAERAEVENELDKEHADELNKLRHQISEQVRTIPIAKLFEIETYVM